VSGAEHTVPAAVWAAHERRIKQLHVWARKKGLLANTALGGDVAATARPQAGTAPSAPSQAAVKAAFAVDGTAGKAKTAAVVAGSAGKALIIGSSVSSGLATDGSGTSVEQQLATDAGFSVTVVSDSQWAAMTTAQFESYRVLIIGDPDCGDSVDTVTEAKQSAATWEPAVMGTGGDKVLIGTDPVYHYSDGSAPNGDVLIENGIAYAGAVAGATGVYLDLSCTYNGSGAGTAVPILDGLSAHGAGQFTVVGTGPLNACSTNVNMVANTGPTAGLSDSDLSDWNCSVHEAFDKFPADYTPLAIAPSSSGFPISYCGTDVDTEATACGSPYILISGTGIVSGGATLGEQGGAPPSVEHSTTCGAGDPVNCATGTFWHTFTDVSVPGNGAALDLTRTYSSANAATDGPFGYGWTDSYNMSLTFDGSGDATVTGPDGSPVTFFPNGSGGYVAPPHVLATFGANGDGTYTYSPYSNHIQYIFNPSGQLVSEVDRNGYTTNLGYTGSLLTSVTDPSGRTLSFSYSGSHITKLANPAGSVWTYDYDSAGNLTKSTDPLGHSWSFTYDPNHLLLSMTDPDGGTTTNTYNGSSQVVQQVDPDGNSTTWAYSGNPATAAGSTTTITGPDGNVTVEDYENMQMLSVTHGYGTPQAATTSYQYDPNTLGVSQITTPNGGVTTKTYDNQGNLLTSTDPLGDQTVYTYNSFDESTSETDPLGNITTWIFDTHGNLLSKTVPTSNGGSATWSYQSGTGSEIGDVVSVTDADGHTTTYGYDSAGDQTSVTEPAGTTTTSTYDADGHLLATTTPKGETTSYAYDGDGELARITDPLGNATSYTYDRDGNETSVTDANGNATRYAYDSDGEQTTATQPSGAVTRTGYDGDGNITSQSNGNGNTTSYTYTPLGQVASSTNPDGKTTSYVYDTDGNLLTETLPSSAVTSYSYDLSDRLTGIAYPGGTTPSVTYAYDAGGNRVSTRDGTGTSSYNYTPTGQLSSETTGAGQTTSYTYNNNGNVTGITYPNAQTVSYSYNANGQMASLQDWLGNTVNFAYDKDGLQTNETLPGGVGEAATYDGADQLTAISDSNTSGSLATFNYTRDADGDVTGATAAGQVTGSSNYSYNRDNLLTSDNSSTFGYDAAGNPTTYGGQPQTFDPAAQLQSSGTVNSTLMGPGSSAGGGGSTTSTTPTGAPVTSTPPPVVAPAASGSTVTGHVTVESMATATRASKGILSVGVTVRKSGSLLLAFVALEPGRGATTPKAQGLRWKRLAIKRGAGADVAVWGATATRKGHVAIKLGGVAHDRQTLLEAVQFAPGTEVRTSATKFGKRSVPATHERLDVGDALWVVGHFEQSMGGSSASSGRTVAAKTVSSKLHAGSWVQRTAVAKTSLVKLSEGRRAKQWVLASVALVPPSASTARGRHEEAAQASRAAVAPAVSARISPFSTTSSGSTFVYDQDGARSEITSGGAAVDLAYNGANELTSIGGSVSYAYDGDGLRASKSVDGTTTNFAWDTTAALPLLLQSGSTYYIYGPTEQPVEQITGSTPTYLLADQQGSTRLLTNTSGSVVGTYSYDAWGNVTAHTGDSTNLQYDGQYTDAETGYQYLRSRYYDPTTGQFLSVDPALRVTGAPYSYAADSPVGAADPTGNWAAQICFGICIGYDSSQSGLEGLQVGPGLPGFSYGPSGSSTGSVGGGKGIGLSFVCNWGGTDCTTSVCLGLGVAACDNASGNFFAPSAPPLSAPTPVPAWEQDHQQYMKQLTGQLNDSIGVPVYQLYPQLSDSYSYLCELSPIP
jgi:RHS repeat-associated protein